MFNKYCKAILKRDSGVYKYSEQFRAGRESQQLWDLGCTIEEKYSPARGWDFSLRSSFVENVHGRNKQRLNTEDGKVVEKDVFEDR